MSRFDAVFERVCQFTDYERMTVRRGFERSLNGVRGLLERLGNPQDAFRSVHVAGTKGKGSTVEMIAEILARGGGPVGRYTSPHLEDLSERIAVDGEPIDHEALATAFEAVLAAADERGPDEEPATFFDLMTAAAFWHYRESGVRYAVIEAGLGGRLDSTNVIRPEAGVITSISLDHVEVLGPDLASIAREKAGIVKPNMIFACDLPVDDPPACEEVLEACRRSGVEPLRLGTEIRVDDPSEGGTFDVHVGGRSYRDLRLVSGGRHQRRNAALAVAVVDALVTRGTFSVDESQVRRGLERVRLPGRGEWVDPPGVLLDGAHNVASARALRELIDTRYAGRPCTFVVSIAEDKDWKPFLESIIRPGDRVVGTRTQNPRVLDPARLCEHAGRLSIEARVESDAHEALRHALDEDATGRLVCVTGSLYLVGELRGVLREKR